MTFMAAKAIPWGAIARVVFWILAAVAVFLVLRAGYLTIYNRGVADERARMLELQAQANAQAREEEQDATVASEEIADTTRAEAEAGAAATAEETRDSIERIEYVYLQSPALAKPCTADGTPAPVAVGVWEELQAATAARNAAAAAAR